MQQNPGMRFQVYKNKLFGDTYACGAIGIIFNFPPPKQTGKHCLLTGNTKKVKRRNCHSTKKLDCHLQEVLLGPNS